MDTENVSLPIFIEDLIVLNVQPVTEGSDLAERFLQVVRSHKRKAIQILVRRFKTRDVLQQLPVELLYLLFRRLPFLYFKFKILVDRHQFLLLRNQLNILTVKFYKYRNLGTKYLRIDRLIDVINGAGLIAFVHIFVAVVVRRNKYDGNVFKLFAFVNQRRCFEAVEIRHLHIHHDHREIMFIQQNFQCLTSRGGFHQRVAIGFKNRLYCKEIVLPAIDNKNLVLHGWSDYLQNHNLIRYNSRSLLSGFVM